MSRRTPELYALIRDEVYGERTPRLRSGYPHVAAAFDRGGASRQSQLATRNEDVLRRVLEFLAWGIEVADEDRTDGRYDARRNRVFGSWPVVYSVRGASLKVPRERAPASPRGGSGKLGAEIDDEFKRVPGGAIRACRWTKPGTSIRFSRTRWMAFSTAR